MISESPIEMSQRRRCNTHSETFRVKCVVFQIQQSNLVIAAQYIPPSNSIYYDEIYMKDFNLNHGKYKLRKLVIVGDLNARIGNNLSMPRSYNNISTES